MTTVDQADTTSCGFRKITEPRELFVWLFQQVETQIPQITVNRVLTEAKDDLFEAVRDGRVPVYHLHWHRILHNVNWMGYSNGSARQCSLGMLTFMGHIGQFTHKNPNVPVPMALAIEMLACVSRVGVVLVGGFSEDRAWVRTTSESASNLGVEFDMALDRDADGFDCWDWDGCRDMI